LGLPSLDPIVRRANVLFVSREELHMLTSRSALEEACSDLLGLGVGMVIVKLGADGIYAALKGRSLRRPAIPPRQLRDRTGAGDVAAAGFLAGLMRSLPLETCLEIAAAAASRSIEGYGRSAYPDETFLNTFV
jgi:ribokinase